MYFMPRSGGPGSAAPGGADLSKPKPGPRKVTAQHIADIRSALDFAQDIARKHGDDCRLAFRKADRALAHIVTELFAKGQ
jgi:hypothetical protein